MVLWEVQGVEKRQKSGTADVPARAGRTRAAATPRIVKARMMVLGDVFGNKKVV